MPQLSKSANITLSSNLSLGELHVALKGMESGKVPGINGLPIEFYNFFWSIVGEDLLQVLNESLNTGLVPISSRRAVITFFPKKGDLLEIRNWCPVSLLCSNYKLLSKVLATRLSKVIDQIVHPDQTYCIP